MCEIKVTYIVQSNPSTILTLNANPVGTFNGENYYYFDLIGVGFIYIYFDSVSFQWVLNNELGTSPIEAFLNSTASCPEGTWNLITPKVLELRTENSFVQLNCDCGVELTFGYRIGSEWIFDSFVIFPTGEQYGRDVYEFERSINGVLYGFILGWNPTSFQWELLLIDLQNSSVYYIAFIPELNSNCPILEKWQLTETGNVYLRQIASKGVECKTCDREERVFRKYDSIKLPQTFVEQKRGDVSCCCKYLVLAGNGTETWKNDKTSAWIKLSDPSDVFAFELTKNGVATNYIPTPKPFINEINAFFTTIEWSDVLNLDGVGCYHLAISYEISGVVGSIPVGEFELKPYSVENALKTARVRAIFDGVHETDGINFTGSGVESTFRFFGYIGNRQPNTEIDNIIYQNREMKRVIRENLNTYELITDPENECIIKPLLDLYLLSENQLFISDYNAHNHSYRYLDLPVTLNESAEIEYKDFSRLAVLKCTFEDRFKNNRTYYG